MRGYLNLKLAWNDGQRLDFDETDAGSFVHALGGEIWAYRGMERVDRAGHFTLFCADLESAEQFEHSAWEVCDTSEDTAPYYQKLFHGNVLLPSVAETIRVFHEPKRLVIIERLELLPRYRGKGHGLMAMRELIRRFAFGGVVAITPWPLQHSPRYGQEPEWRREMEVEAFRAVSKSQAANKLRDYYGILGFVPIGRGRMMVANPDEALISNRKIRLKIAALRREHGAKKVGRANSPRSHQIAAPPAG
jgi:GNAT superfamily N-acetyltransferase